MTFEIRYCPTLDPQIVTQRIIFNPNYGGAGTEVPGACTVPIRHKGIKPKTRQAIQDSIAKDGFRNPILVYSTSSGVHLSFGGGRVMAAQNLDKEIPAIVVDYAGHFVLFEEVTQDNWRKFFLDAPKYFEFTDVGISTHYGLERGREEEFDAAGTAWAKSLDDASFLKEESPWLR